MAFLLWPFQQIGKALRFLGDKLFKTGGGSDSGKDDNAGHYHNPGNGYWPKSRLVIMVDGPDVAQVKKAWNIWAAVFGKLKIPMEARIVTPNGELPAGVPVDIFIGWDSKTNPKVGPNETGTTIHEGVADNTPWVYKFVQIFVRRGVSGAELFILLVHELLHALGVQGHSKNRANAGHPKSGVSVPTASDERTLELAYKGDPGNPDFVGHGGDRGTIPL